MNLKNISNLNKKRLEHLALIIKNYRLNESLTQKDFGSISKVHVNTIHNLEQNRSVTIITLFKCVDAMGIRVSELFEDIP